MPKVDWSKPIELWYAPSGGAPRPCPAEVVATGLKGRFSVRVRWRDSIGCVKENADDEGYIPGYSWRIRNVPTKVTKYILLSKRLNPGETSKDSRVVVMYDTYEEAVANCASTHKVVEVTYEL